MNRSVLWIQPDKSHSEDRSRIARLRAAQFLPVPVESIDTALHLLRQFQAGAVIVRTTSATWEECTRLVAGGAPVLALVAPAHTSLMDRYLLAGCAAVVVEPCPFKDLQAVLQRVASGEREVRWPDTSVAQVG
jgi:AmiR/NasT family two-component response regulator